MKRIITAAVLLFSLSLQANPSLHAYELMRLPHPLKLIVENADALKLTEKQHAELDAMMAAVPAEMHPLLEEAKAKESAIRMAVMLKHKSKAETAKALDELCTLKRRITETHIDALNRLQALLNEQQYSALIKLLKASHKQQNGGQKKP